MNDIYIQQKNADNLKLTVPVLQDTPAAPDTPLDMPVSDAIPQEVVGQGEFNELPVIEVKAARPERELTPQNALQDLFGDKRKASVKIDGSATGLGRAYQGEVRLANGEILEDGKFPQNIRITLPPAYGANATMKLTLIDEENGIYETSAKDRNFQIVVDDNGNVSIQSVNVDELQSKLDANLDTYRQLEAEKAAETAAKEAEDAAKQAEEEQKRVNYNMQKAQVEAERLADDLYGASNDYGAVGAGTSFDRHFAKLNKDNICMVLSQYDKQHPDESLIDTICSEVTSSKKDRKAALNKILDNLTAAAREAGVPEADITKARGEFSASMEAEFKKFGLINPSNMEKSANYLRGLISAKELGSVDMDESEAMESITGAAAETYQTARETFDTARAEEGWAAKTGDTVLGWFGCTTKDDMETKLGAYKADVEKLQNAKSEAEFKQTFEDVFGVPFDSKRVAAYEAARSDYAVAYGAKEQMDIYGNLSLKGASSAVDYESLKNECCSVTGMKPEELDKLIAQMSSEQPGVDNKKLLNQFIDNLYDASEQTYNNIAHGRDLEQIGADVDRIRQSAFGTRDIVKDVIEYNTNQQMTDMAVEAAGEIALTIALQAIPGAGQAALLKLSASTAKWGARGIKIARYTDKAAAALKKADTAINTGKTVNITRAKKAVAGAATAGTATFAVDMSNGKSVKEALNKALMNASFAGAGSLTGELGPIISKTYGIEGKLANEIAQEITERAMDVGTSAAITAAFNGGYTENDAFLDFATGIIMSRVGRGFKGKTTTETPSGTPANAPAGTPSAASSGTPANAPSATPVLERASSQGEAVPSSVTVGERKANQIREEVNQAVSDSEISGDELARIRQEAEGISNRELRRETQRKIDDAAQNLPPDELAAFDAANNANMQKNIDHIFEKHSELNASDVRVLNEYIGKTDNIDELKALKEKLNTKQYSPYGGVTAEFTNLRKAIDNKIAKLESSVVKSDAQLHDDVVSVLNEKARTGKGLNENEFKQIKQYLDTINNEAQLNELKSLLNGRKMSINQKKQLREALAAKTEELRNTPSSPVDEVPTQPVDADAVSPVDDVPTQPVDADVVSPVDEVPTQPVDADAVSPVDEVPTQPVDADGTVKTPDEIKFEYDDNSIKEYDAAGNVTRETWHDSDGSSIEAEYDASGKQTRGVVRSSDGSFREYEYDTAGNRTREIEHNPDGSVIVEEYDVDNNMTRQIQRDADGSVIGSTDFEYDASGSMTREINRYADGRSIENEYDVSGNMTRQIQRDADGSFYDFELDASGNVIRRINRDADGSVIGSTDFEYDASGNMTRQIERDADGNSVDYKYDASGNMTRRIERDADGSVIDSYDFEYDASGNMTRRINSNADGSVIHSTDYEYDASGNMTRQIERDADGSSTDFEYDASGNKIREINRYADGRSIDYEYDASGSMTREINRYADGSFSDFEYDASGNVIRRINSNADGSVTGSYDCEYDASGNKIRLIDRNADGSVINSYDFEYDASGNEIREIYRNADGSVIHSSDFEYDASGNKIRRINSNADGSVIGSTDFEYDASGNMTRQIERDADGTIISIY